MSTSASSDIVRSLRRDRLPSRRRILHCLRAPVGGLFRHVRDLATAQATLGHAVGIVCDSTPCDSLSESRLENLKNQLELGLFRTSMSRDIGPADISAYLSTRHFAERCRADILHGHGAKGGAYARLTALALKRGGAHVACYYTPHGGSLHYHPSTLKGRFYMGLERRLAALTDGLIFESAYSARRFAAHVGHLPCQSRVIHNGVLADELMPRLLEDDAADFLFIGELRHLKGVDVLLEALQDVQRSTTASALIVGEGPDAEAFRKQAADLSLAGAVTFCKSLPVKQALARGRCVIVPSRAESLPYVVLEAASAGVPLIATDVGGLPEIVAGTDTPLIRPGDPSALANAMLAVLDDPVGAQLRAHRLRAAVARRFKASAMATAIVDFYGEARRLTHGKR
jgi:glycosyltransferase involved in cell wall biosynthesis